MLYAQSTKTKVSSLQCGNHRGMSLFKYVAKIYESVLENRGTAGTVAIWCQKCTVGLWQHDVRSEQLGLWQMVSEVNSWDRGNMVSEVNSWDRGNMVSEVAKTPHT